MNNTEIYEQVTAKVVQALEEGKIPWQRPWQEMITPRNLVSKKPYRGINVFLLSMTSHASPYWASFKQIKELGGKVKKGEKSTVVIFWKIMKFEDHEAPTGEKIVPLLRYYNVFNIDQTEGINPDKIPALEVNENGPIERCDEICANMPNPPKMTEGGNGAYYAPKLDTVNLPAFEQFKNAESYYATAFHELAHSTGHESRLKRPGIMEFDMFGTERYSKEELVAELSSAMLCSVAQIDKPVFDNTKAYIQHWIGKLNSDPKLIVQAAAQAQKASDLILNVSFDKGTS